MGLQLDREGAVEVLHKGRWLRGRLPWRNPFPPSGLRKLRGRLLHAYRLGNGRWRGIVRYTAGVGEQYEHARDQEEIRSPAADLATHRTAARACIASGR